MASETQGDDVMKLNEDYLAELEEAAKGRYTEEDEDFMKVKDFLSIIFSKELQSM